MYPMKVYIGIVGGYYKSTLVICNDKATRYILNLNNTYSKYTNPLTFNSPISTITWELTNIKTEKELKTHFLTQQLLGG